MPDKERLYPTKKGDSGQPLLTNWINNRKLTEDFSTKSSKGSPENPEKAA